MELTKNNRKVRFTFLHFSPHYRKAISSRLASPTEVPASKAVAAAYSHSLPAPLQGRPESCLRSRRGAAEMARNGRLSAETAAARPDTSRRRQLPDSRRQSIVAAGSTVPIAATAARLVIDGRVSSQTQLDSDSNGSNQRAVIDKLSH